MCLRTYDLHLGSVLQCVAVCCSVLQCVAVRYPSNMPMHPHQGHTPLFNSSDTFKWFMFCLVQMHGHYVTHAQVHAHDWTHSAQCNASRSGSCEIFCLPPKRVHAQQCARFTRTHQNCEAGRKGTNLARRHSGTTLSGMVTESAYGLVVLFCFVKIGSRDLAYTHGTQRSLHPHAY